jgi:hypothetical protein
VVLDLEVDLHGRAPLRLRAASWLVASATVSPKGAVGGGIG